MKNFRLSITAASAEAEALGRLAERGFLRIYDGAQPASPEEDIQNQKLLAQLRCPRRGTVDRGALTLTGLEDEADAPNGGTARWYRVFQSDGKTALWDGTVGTSDADLNLKTTLIQKRSRITIDSIKITIA